MTTTAHIINHTHWDREWFLTSVYTSRWIPGLIDNLERLFAGNPDFRFLFDGQTLVIEDLLHVAPDYEARIRELVSESAVCKSVPITASPIGSLPAANCCCATWPMVKRIWPASAAG